MQNRRRFLAGSALGLGMIAMTGCRPVNPDRLRSSANGFAEMDQRPAIEHGPVADSVPSSPLLDDIRQRGHLKYSGADSLPGFGLLSPITEQTVGFDVGIAQLFAKYIFGEPSLKMIKSGVDSREAALQNHTVDTVISTYSITPERSRLVNFAGPYLTITSGVARQVDDEHIGSASDLAGRKVAVQPGAAEESLHREVPEAIPVRFEESTQCFAALQQERVDAWSANTAILNGLVGTDTRTEVTDIRFGTTKFGIGLPKDDPIVKDFANGFLTTIFADGTWQLLWDSTAGKIKGAGSPTPPPLDDEDGD